jgi:hypothetical protein
MITSSHKRRDTVPSVNKKLSEKYETLHWDQTLERLDGGNRILHFSIYADDLGTLTSQYRTSSTVTRFRRWLLSGFRISPWSLK